MDKLYYANWRKRLRKENGMQKPKKCKEHPGYVGDSYRPGMPCWSCDDLYAYYHQRPSGPTEGRKECCKVNVIEVLVKALAEQLKKD
jgi:hypothetical protein